MLVSSSMSGRKETKSIDRAPRPPTPRGKHTHRHPKDAHLDEANVRGLFPEALAAHVKLVLADQAVPVACVLVGGEGLIGGRVSHPSIHLHHTPAANPNPIRPMRTRAAGRGRGRSTYHPCRPTATPTPTPSSSSSKPGQAKERTADAAAAAALAVLLGVRVLEVLVPHVFDYVWFVVEGRGGWGQQWRDVCVRARLLRVRCVRCGGRTRTRRGEPSVGKPTAIRFDRRRQARPNRIDRKGPAEYPSASPQAQSINQSTRGVACRSPLPLSLRAAVSRFGGLGATEGWRAMMRPGAAVARLHA